MISSLAAEPEVVNQLVRMMRILADPTRIRLLGLLQDHERNVTSLCDELELAQPTVSHHLGLLRSVLLVNNRRAGKQVFYSLNRETIGADGAQSSFSICAGPVRLQLMNGAMNGAMNGIGVG